MVERPVVVWDALLVRPQPTGVGRSILELAHAFSGRDYGLSVVVLATHPELFAFLDEVPFWRVVACPGARGGVWRKAIYTQIWLPRLVRKLGGALFHSLQYVGPLRLACPHVVTVHDLAYQLYPETIEQPRRLYYQLFVPPTLRRCTFIVTNSQATADDVLALFPEASGRVVVTPFGSPSWVTHQPEVGEERVRAAPFLFVGTLEPRKNLTRLLDAYELFLDRCEERSAGPETPDLVLVGARGWQQGDLEPKIRRLQERGKIRLEGYCGPDRLWQHYSSARALLFPSLHEGFGFPILEAMSAKLPVLTSDRGAMREVAGEAALLVNPEDPASIAYGMEILHFDPLVRHQLITAGRHRVTLWNWQDTAQKIASVYHRILEENAARGSQ